jgi:hypothetical protein
LDLDALLDLGNTKPGVRRDLAAEIRLCGGRGAVERLPRYRRLDGCRQVSEHLLESRVGQLDAKRVRPAIVLAAPRADQLLADEAPVQTSLDLVDG